MFCPVCHVALPNDAAVCPMCGRPYMPTTAALSQGHLQAALPAGLRSLRDGLCPKCGATEIYHDAQGLTDASGERVKLSLHDIWHGRKAGIRTYVCGACGFLELYLDDLESIQAIRKTWARLA